MIRAAALKLKAASISSTDSGKSEATSSVPRRVLKEDLELRLSPKRTTSTNSSDDYENIRIEDEEETFGELNFDKRMDIRRLR